MNCFGILNDLIVIEKRPLNQIVEIRFPARMLENFKNNHNAIDDKDLQRVDISAIFHEGQLLQTDLQKRNR